MATDVKARLLTAEEFMAADLGEGDFELVRGEVVELPPGTPLHGRICANVGFTLETYGRRTGIGYALLNDSPVATTRGPDTVRGADVCFYRQDRWPRRDVGEGLPPVVPDLAVEVSCPGDRPREALAKVGEYLEAGVACVWVVYPKARALAVFRTFEKPPRVLHAEDVIEDVPELPGFRCPVADLFV